MEHLETVAPSVRGLNFFLRMEIMAEIRSRVLSKLRSIDPKALWKKTTGALLNSIGAYFIEDRVVFYSTKKYFGPQERGVKPHTMWYLLNKTIPIRGEPGSKPAFRKCTLKSIIRGGWRHPGYEGKHFLQGAIDEVVASADEIVSRVIYKHSGVFVG